MNPNDILTQITNITKSSAYDILVEQMKKMEIENSILKIQLAGAEERIKALQEFINDVRPKDAKVIEMGHPEPPIGDIL